MAGKHGFDAYFFFEMQLAHSTYKRVGPVAGPERAFANEVVAARIVVADIAGTGVEKCAAKRVGVGFGYEGDELEQSAFLRA